MVVIRLQTIVVIHHHFKYLFLPYLKYFDLYSFIIPCLGGMAFIILPAIPSATPTTRRVTRIPMGNVTIFHNHRSNIS